MQGLRREFATTERRSYDLWQCQCLSVATTLRFCVGLLLWQSSLLLVLGFR